MCYLVAVSGFSVPVSGFSAPLSIFLAARAGCLTFRAVALFVFACIDADVAGRGLADATPAVIVVPAVIAVATASTAAYVPFLDVVRDVIAVLLACGPGCSVTPSMVGCWR